MTGYADGLAVTNADPLYVALFGSFNNLTELQ